MLSVQITKNLGVLTFAAALSFGATPVARVISNEPIDVDGITAPARNYTPLSLGDQVSTQTGTAILQFRDGSNVSLQPNSQLRLEGQAVAVELRVTRGAVTYAISSKSHLRIVNSRGEALNRVLEHALPEATSMAHSNMVMEPGVMYRASSRQAGGLAPTGAVAVGQFTGGGVFHATGGATASITTPSGLTLNLTQTTVNGQTVYTVSSISQTVTNPITGQTITVTTTAAQNPNNPLFGSTVGGVTTSTQNGTSVSVTFTGTNGTPLTTGQLTGAVGSATQTALNTAITSGQLPPNTPLPTPTPVTTGQFSGSAS